MMQYSNFRLKLIDSSWKRTRASFVGRWYCVNLFVYGANENIDDLVNIIPCSEEIETRGLKRPHSHTPQNERIDRVSTEITDFTQLAKAIC
jgi:hypothetical protein